MTAGIETGPVRADGALHFPLQGDERVLKIYRKHWFYLWPRTVAMALAAFVYAAYWGIRIFLNWYRYNNDIWVVTNQRLIDSTKTNPFNLKISTADLVNVQDMTVERSGIFRTMFNYGDVVCQTAADIQEFRLSGIPDPQDAQLLVDKERDRERMRGRQ